MSKTMVMSGIKFTDPVSKIKLPLMCWQEV